MEVENTQLNIRNNDEGYAIIAKEYFHIDTSKVKGLISRSNHVKSFLGTPFYSIENLFLTIPEVKELILPKVKFILDAPGMNYRCVKSTYYDKPSGSNWELSFHQDICVNLNKMLTGHQFCSWAKRKNYYEAKASADILEKTITLRLHLDDCGKENGALKIVPGSHKMGLIDVFDYKENNVKYIEVTEGDILKMCPLLLHASANNHSKKRRRVVHMEFSNLDLPWYEEHELGEVCN